MSNIEEKLIKLIDLARKDSGINSAKDAVEQISLLLLLKGIYYSRLLGGENNNHYSFENLFYDNDCFNGLKINSDFSSFKNILYRLEDDFSELRPEKLSSLYELLNILPLRIRSEKILERVICEISDIYFGDGLSEAYDKLVVKMVNDSISTGEYHSPKALVSAIVQVVKPISSQSIYDPAMGTARFFVESIKHVVGEKNTLLGDSLLITGRDISPFAYLVGTLNSLLNGLNINDVFLRDSLLEDDAKTYDLILSAIPFGKVKDIGKYENGNYHHTQSLELMFLKHTMRKLSKDGRAALIVPDGVLFSHNKETIILREELLTEFNLHSILSLPTGTLSPYTSVKTSVIFFENKNPEEYIWFYELKNQNPYNKKNQISERDLINFIESFPSRLETENSCLVSKKEILNREYSSLSIKLPDKNDEVESINLSDELSLLNEKKIEIDSSLSNLTDLLSENKKAKFVDRMTIGELFTTKSGKSLTKVDIEIEGDYPVYGGNGVMGFYKDFNVDGENIFIGRVGAHCGNVHFTKGPIWLTDNSFRVDVKLPEKVYLPYLAHVLRSLNLNKLSRGSAQPSISYSKIKDIEIYLPSYQQQVELSEWFEELQLQKQKVSEVIKEQTKKLNELTSYVINSNCLEARL
ncbi:N-6 DNA methylase [Photobacterium sanguinicancri]|uniref:site-specific DNA-methyltransferase (adenine-specific) n=1 Tax=Photobacterium sanguinicancri TaxID=875932 RepID=A0AAW7Y4G2_9GAMM|nr:N-6 DNA methylase [Photobacterium sanguinicancri]MDO6543247.1 N-6 DNA methylase [Photobacterium sanguinicancri]